MASYDGSKVCTSAQGSALDKDMESAERPTKTCSSAGQGPCVTVSAQDRHVADVKSLVDDFIKPHFMEPKVLLNTEDVSSGPKKLPLDEVYVDVLLIPSHAVKDSPNLSFSVDECRGQKIELSDLFDDVGEVMRTAEKRRSSYRVLVTASPGTGKTILFLQMAAMKWARGDMWPTFSIVVAWPFRLPSVQQANNVVELLQLEQLNITDPGQQKAIALFIRKNPHKLCLILDGADEVDLHSCSSYVQRVIRGELLKGCYVILTSRYSKQILELSAACPFDKHIEVLGFTQKDIYEYISKTLLSPAMHAAVLEKMEIHPQLASLMRVPAFSVAICDIIRSRGIVPVATSDVMSMLVLRVIHQNTQHQYRTWSAVPRLLQEQILELGRFSFMMLLEKKVVFSENDFYKHGLSENARWVGFLIPCNHVESSPICLWRLSHLIFQEFLSALFIAYTCPRIVDIPLLVDSVSGDLHHLSAFWCILGAHLSADAKETLLEAMLTDPIGVSRPTSTMHSVDGTSHLDRHLFCSEQDLLQLRDVICCNMHPHGLDQLAESLLTGLLPGSVLHEVRSSIRGHSHLDFLTAALHLWKQKVPRANFSMLHSAIESIDAEAATNVSLAFSKQNTSLEARQASVESRLLKLTLEERCYCASHDDKLLAFKIFAEQGFDRSAVSLKPSRVIEWLLTHCSGVAISNCQLTSADCKAIGAVMYHHSEAVSRLILINTGVDDNCYSHMCAGLEQCQKLKSFKLIGTKLTDCHAAHVARIIVRNSANLEHLRTLGNDITIQGHTLLHSGTHLCSKLYRLALGPNTKFNSSSPGSRDAWNMTMAGILVHCRQVRFLELKRCIAGDSGLAALQPALAQMPSVTHLYLPDNDITASGCHSLVSIIQAHGPRLSLLDISSNGLGDSGLSAMLEPLKTCRSLFCLVLSDTSLTSHSLRTLASLLHHLEHVNKLALEGNDFRGANYRSEQLFVMAVRDRKHYVCEVKMPRKPACSQSLVRHLPDSVNYADE